MIKEAFIETLTKFCKENEVPLDLKETDRGLSSICGITFDEVKIEYLAGLMLLLTDDSFEFCCGLPIDTKVSKQKLIRIAEMMTQRYGFHAEFLEKDSSLTVSAAIDYDEVDSDPDYVTEDIIEYSIYRPIDLVRMFAEAVFILEEQGVSPGEAMNIVDLREDDICGCFDFTTEQ